MNDEMSDERKKEVEDVDGMMSETGERPRLSIELEVSNVEGREAAEDTAETMSRLLAAHSEFDPSDDRYSLIEAGDAAKKFAATGLGEQALLSAASKMAEYNAIAKLDASLGSHVKDFKSIAPLVDTEKFKSPAIEKFGLGIREVLDSIRPTQPGFSALTEAAKFSLDSELLHSLMVDVPPITPPIQYMAPYMPPVERYEPIPKGGFLCFDFQVTRGTVEQVGDVLTHEFDRLKLPLFHLVEHENSNSYWHIVIYHGDEAEAKELIEARDDTDNWHNYLAISEREDNIEQIGYVFIADRPIVPVRFFIFDEKNRDRVVSLAYRVASELSQSGFELHNNPQAEESLPEGAEILDDFTSTVFEITTDNLKGWIRSYLQANGYVPESAFVESKIYEGQICIQYLFAECIVRFKTKAEKVGRTDVKPDIHCWESNPLKREQHIIQARDHLIDLITTIKNEIGWSPKTPDPSEPLDTWFDYYHERKEAGIKITLDDIAHEVGLSGGYVRQEHSKYMAERKD